MATKVSDNRIIPQCRKCHSELHRIGERAFFGACLDDAITLGISLYNSGKDWGKAIKLILSFRREFYRKNG